MPNDSIIVFLENNCNRAAIQYQRMSKINRERTFWVKTVVETIDILKNYKDRLDIVSLCYNLNENEEGSPHPANENCGMEVVRWLESKDSNLYSHIRFIVHDWDLFMGKKMTVRLQNHGYRAIQIPFGL